MLVTLNLQTCLFSSKPNKVDSLPHSQLDCQSSFRSSPRRFKGVATARWGLVYQHANNTTTQCSVQGLYVKLQKQNVSRWYQFRRTSGTDWLHWYEHYFRHVADTQTKTNAFWCYYSDRRCELMNESFEIWDCQMITLSNGIFTPDTLTGRMCCIEIVSTVEKNTYYYYVHAK